MTQPGNTALKDTLDTFVQEEGLRPLSRRTGIPLGVIRAILEERDVSGANLRAVTDKLGLEFYIGPKRTNLGRPSTAPSARGAAAENTAFVDHFDLQVSAGAGAGALGVSTPGEPVAFYGKWLRQHNLRPTELSILEVRGDSMEPILFEGDPILVDKQKSKPKSGLMYVVVRRDSVQVKWVTVLRNAVQLVSENEHYPPERIDAHDAPEFYRVRWFGHFIR